MKETDIIIIGAGPTGLFAVFEAGLLRLKCHLIDTLPQVGGQLTELYPKKPIFDIPGYPSVGASELIDNLMEQIKQFQPEFTLGETAITLTKNNDDTFIVTTDKGTQIKGDSALDWSIYLAEKVATASVTLVHRRNEFRGALDSVEKVKALKEAGKINLKTPYEVIGLEGNGHLESLVLEQEGGNKETLLADAFIPLFGLTPKLGPIATWGVEIEKNAVKVNNALDYQTCIEGVYAIGDVNTYPGKLKLILCGFHEATLMCQSVYNRIYPNKKYVLKYTTVVGIDGFDGSRKEAEKAVVKAI